MKRIFYPHIEWGKTPPGLGLFIVPSCVGIHICAGVMSLHLGLFKYQPEDAQKALQTMKQVLTTLHKK